MKDSLLFFKRFIASPSTVGSFIPSSQSLGKKITKKICSETKQPKRILEIGAGSGVLTQHIVKKLSQDDYLDVVEYDSYFCASLQKKFAHLPNVAIHHLSILDFHGGEYDAIISGLPTNSFVPTFLEHVLRQYKNLSKKGGTLSFFEYIGLPHLKKAYLFGQNLEDFKMTLQLKKEFVNQYREEVDHSWLNIMPARIHHCRM